MAPPKRAVIRCGAAQSSGRPCHSRTSLTMMRYVRSTVSALARTETRLIERATYAVGTNMEKNRPTSM